MTGKVERANETKAEIEARRERNWATCTELVIRLETETDPAERAVTADLLHNARRRYLRADAALRALR